METIPRTPWKLGAVNAGNEREVTGAPTDEDAVPVVAYIPDADDGRDRDRLAQRIARLPELEDMGAEVYRAIINTPDLDGSEAWTNLARRLRDILEV